MRLLKYLAHLVVFLLLFGFLQISTTGTPRIPIPYPIHTALQRTCLDRYGTLNKDELLRLAIHDEQCNPEAVQTEIYEEKAREEMARAESGAPPLPVTCLTFWAPQFGFPFVSQVYYKQDLAFAPSSVGCHADDGISRWPVMAINLVVLGAVYAGFAHLIKKLVRKK